MTRVRWIIGAVLVALLVWAAPASAANQEQRAMQFYQRTWNVAAKFYGAEGMPAPKLSWLREEPADGEGYVAGDGTPEGIRQLYLGPYSRAQMASRDWFWRDVARTRLLHEWAHIYQDSGVFARKFGPPVDKDPTSDMDDPEERFADRFGVNRNNRLRRLYARQWISKLHATNRPVPRRLRLSASMKVKPMSPFARREQFGERWGQDPTTLLDQQSGYWYN